MIRINRFIVKLTAILFFFNVISPSLLNSTRAEEITQGIYIDTVKDFKRFIQNSSLDTYSYNKTFILRQDLDFGGELISPVPIFSGTFQGNGHEIRGFKISSPGSNLGLFRYIEKTGVVNNLFVSGDIVPDGSQTNIGGIAGKNNGRIFNCIFNGTVQGKTNIGGITGVNSQEGYISNCTSEGVVSGEHSTGGISGLNHGIIMKSSNHSSVNTDSTESAPNLKDINMSTFTKKDNTIRHTDTGGITGFSDGAVSNSVNFGKVGYPHVGYNISGIAGRQSGYISNCTNKGEIFGRKDVGGIVGQMEPYLQIKFSEDTLKKVDRELISLRNLIDSTLNHVDSSSIETRQRMDSILSSTDEASFNLKNLMDATSSFTDDTVDNVNELFYRFSLIVDVSEPVLEDLENSTKLISEAFLDFSDGFACFKASSVNFEAASVELGFAFKTLSGASFSAAEGIRSIKESMELLEKNLGDPEKMKKAREDLYTALDDFEKSIQTISQTMLTLAELFGGLENFMEINWVEIQKKLVDSAHTLSESMTSSIENFKKGATSLSQVISNDINTLKESFGKLKNGLSSLENSAQLIGFAMINLSKGSEYFKSGFNMASVGFEYFDKGAETLKSSSEYMTSGFNKLKNVISDINTKPRIVFPRLNDKISDSNENLFKSLDSLSQELSLLNDESSEYRETFVKNLKSINQKVYDVFKIIIDARKRTLEGVELYNDISQDDIEIALSEKGELLKGYVHGNINFGSISGDINIGGIVGSMSIEYDFDPEGELIPENKSTLKFQYQTRTILNNCTNRGYVLSKKDYAGGITGRMNLGLLMFSNNFGNVKSIDGDYVGGICGYSSTMVRDSYSLCSLSGRKFVGGITGSGTDIYDCASLINIIGAQENFGSISGEVLGEIENNSFVSPSLHGVDGISYNEKAYPMSYDNFMELDGLPNEFKNFTIHFKALGDTLKVQKFNYGDSLLKDVEPNIPELAGHFSHWPTFDYSNLTFSHVIEAIYTPFITSISSDSKTDDGLPLVLAEGYFTPSSSVSLVSEVNVLPKIPEDDILLDSKGISIKNVSEESTEPLILRYYYPNIKKSSRLLLFIRDHWEETTFEIDGSYIVFKSELNDISFYLVDTPFNIFKVLYPILSIMIVLLLIIILVKLYKRKSIRKKITL